MKHMLSEGIRRAEAKLAKIKMRPAVIAVAGGSCSGKTTLSAMLSKNMDALFSQNG